MPTKNRPFADSRFAKHLRTQILRMKGVKSQIEIATEAGFTNPNVISMLKNGATRMPEGEYVASDLIDGHALYHTASTASA